MAYKVFDGLNYNENSTTNVNKIILDSDSGQRVELPDRSYVSDANITRSGEDLVLETPDGIVVVEGYFSTLTPPDLSAPDGTTLTPELVNSFMRSDNKYAETNTHSDVSPVGAVQEIAGEATVTRLDGTVEVVGIGTPIYQGDVIETDENGAVNIMFVDQTTFAVSEDARLAIDEYVFDPATQSGTTNFSVLKGVFVFTSGLIGREDPDDVMINTPSGSIGIRGTIIAGDVDAGEITVIEGAIVLYDLSGNTMTLSTQFETAKFNLSSSTIDHMGELGADDVSAKFMSVSTVAADLFSSIEDAANDDTPSEVETPVQTSEEQDEKDASAEQAPEGAETTENAAADETTEGEGETAEASSEEEVVTSDDILGEADSDATDTSSASDGNNGEAQDTSGSDDGSAGEDGAQFTPPEAQEAVPFSITVTRLPFTENVNGQDVAIVQGNLTNFTTLNLLGTSLNYYDVTRIDDNSFLISLKPTVSMDAEDEYSLFIHATNETGAANIVRDIDPLTINVDDAVTYDAVAPNVTGVDNYFIGSTNTTLTYDMNQEFSDDEGITSLTLLGSPSHADLASITLVDGILNVQLNGSIAGGSFNFTVRAYTDTEFIDQTFTFETVDATTGSPVLASPGAVYSGNDSSITIAANNVSVFSDVDYSSNDVLISGTGAYVKTGGGEDDITINAGSTGYHVYGDAGDDIVHLSELNGKSYGGDGDDKFIIENTASQAGLESLTTSTTRVNGGGGFDTLEFSSNVSGNINFSNVDNGLVTNIEALDFDNGTGHFIDLHYNNVIEMTDESNTLIINMDANDTLSFNNTSSNTFFQAPGTVTVDSQTYNVFTDGTITLLVDVEASNVTGIV